MSKKYLEKMSGLVFVVVVSIIFLFAIVYGCLKIKYDRLYVAYIEQYSSEFYIDKNLVYGVIYAESSFDSDATSSVGAVGLMQVLPSTAEWISEELKIENFDKNLLYNPQINIQFGCFYLNYLFQKFKSEDIVLFCYNAGEGVFYEEIKTKSFEMVLEEYPNVKKYINAVKQAKNMYEFLY